jgi:hypothetical protein
MTKFVAGRWPDCAKRRGKEASRLEAVKKWVFILHDEVLRRGFHC